MPAPRIDIWHNDRPRVAARGQTQPWANLLGRITCDDAPIYTAAYQCNDGPFTPLMLGPSAYRLREPGDFNIELPFDALHEGENVVQIWASNHAGEVTRRDVVLEHRAVERCPLPAHVAWGELDAIDAAAHVIDGHWRITPAGVRPVTLAYDRLIAIGDMTWGDYTASVTATIHGYETLPAVYNWPSYGPALGVLMGWQGHRQWGDMVPPRGWHPFGSLAIYRWHKDGPMRKELWAGVRGEYIGRRDCAHDPELERPYVFKLQSRTQPGAPSHFAMKVYPADEPEPADWDIQGQAVPGSHTHGSLVLLAHHTDVTFGDVTVEPAGDHGPTRPSHR